MKELFFKSKFISNLLEGVVLKNSLKDLVYIKRNSITIIILNVNILIMWSVEFTILINIQIIYLLH